MAASVVNRNRPTCDFCNQPTVKQCSKCKRIHFCSPACQKSAFAIHKLVCQKAGSPDEDYTTCDAKGLSPFHYAWIYRKKEAIPAHLHPLSSFVKSTLRMTPDYCEKVTAPVLREGMTPLYRMGSEDPISQEEYFKITGSDYLSRTIATPEDFIQYHEDPPSIRAAPIDLFEERPEDALIIQNFEQNPRKLILAEESPEMQLGLMAGERFEKGALVAPYYGVLKMHPATTFRAHQFNLRFGERKGKQLWLDATTHSSAARAANDNPPKGVFVTVFKAAELPYFAYRTLEVVEMYTFFNWSYGTCHHIKLKPNYCLTDPNLLHISQFIKNRFSTVEHMHQMRDLFLKNISDIDEVRDFNIMLYLLATPPVLYKLHLMEIMHSQMTLAFITSNEMQERLNEISFGCPVVLMPQILQNIHLLLKEHQILIPTLLSATSSLSSIGISQVLNSLSPQTPEFYEVVPDLIEREKIFDDLLFLLNLDNQYREEAQDATLDILPLLRRYAALSHIAKKDRMLSQRLNALSERAQKKGNLARAKQMHDLIQAFYEVEVNSEQIELLPSKYNLDECKANLN